MSLDSRTRIARLSICTLLVLALLPVTARAAGLDLKEAEARLDALDEVLGSSRAVTEDQIEALDQVEASYLALLPAVTPETEAAFAAWRKRAEKLYLKAFVLVKPDRSKELNLRALVNVRAAQILGRTGRVALWQPMRRLLETRHFKARYDVSQPVLDAAFDAIAALGDPRALEWMADEFIHTNSSPEPVVARLVAAQQAFVKFPLEKIPGTLRYAIVKKMVQLYPATESVARQSSNDPAIRSTRRFWDRIRTGAIRAAQHLSGTPRNADGEALATMQEFADWFRHHKSARKAPWADPVEPRG